MGTLRATRYPRRLPFLSLIAPGYQPYGGIVVGARQEEDSGTTASLRASKRHEGPDIRMEEERTC